MSDWILDRCVACGACVKKCKKVSVEALKMENNKIVRDANKCIGCGECVINCPMSAWTRSPKNSSLLSRFLNDKKLTFAANSLSVRSSKWTSSLIASKIVSLKHSEICSAHLL